MPCPRAGGRATELQGGSQATRAACKPLLARLGADSPSLSHLLPSHSPPTCPPSCCWQATPLICLTSLGAPPVAALKWGGRCLWGGGTSGIMKPGVTETGWLKGGAAKPLLAAPLSSRPSPPLPCPPPSVTAGAVVGGWEGRNGEGDSRWEKERKRRGGRARERVWSDGAEKHPLILPQIPPFRHNSCKCIFASF